MASGLSEAMEVESDSNLAEALERLRNRQLADEYAPWTPLVSRFVEAELDAEAPSKRGMGRITGGDPPPRFGAKYRRVLEDDEASAVFEHAAQQTVLGGFAARAALFEEEVAPGLEADVVWSRLLRRVSASYNSVNQMLQRAKEHEPTPEGYASVPRLTIVPRISRSPWQRTRGLRRSRLPPRPLAPSRASSAPPTGSPVPRGPGPAWRDAPGFVFLSAAKNVG
jgi:hypothetical protein